MPCTQLGGWSRPLDSPVRFRPRGVSGDNPSTGRPASTLTTLGLSSTTTPIPHASANTLAQPQFSPLFLLSPQGSLQDYAYAAEGLLGLARTSRSAPDYALVREILVDAWRRFHTRQGWQRTSESLIPMLPRRPRCPTARYRHRRQRYSPSPWKRRRFFRETRCVSEPKWRCGGQVRSSSSNRFFMPVTCRVLRASFRTRANPLAASSPFASLWVPGVCWRTAVFLLYRT